MRAELLQYFGIYALGHTFDSIDIAFFAIGLVKAMSVDWIFAKIFIFWDNV